MNVMKINSKKIVPSVYYLNLIHDFLQKFPKASLGGSFVLRGCKLLPRDIHDVDFVVPTSCITDVQNYITSITNDRVMPKEFITSIELLDDGFGGKHIHTFIDALKLTDSRSKNLRYLFDREKRFGKIDVETNANILKIGVFFQDGGSGFQVYDEYLDIFLNLQNIDTIIQAKEYYVKEKPEAYSSQKHVYDLEFIKQHYENFKVGYALNYIL